MELEIWTELKPTKKGVTLVRLVKEGRTLEVEVVDAKGNRVHGGTIAELSSDGFERTRCLSPDLGFPLDDQGRIRDV